MRIGLAFQLFFKALAGGKTADALQAVLQGKSVESKPAAVGLPSPEAKAKPEAKVKLETQSVPKPAPSSQSEAITLLATLQREARLIDLVQEPLEQYSDAQVGAAARDVLRDTRKVLERICGLKPLLAETEGSNVEIPADASPMRWKISGSSTAAKQGTVVHPGWQATHCQLPQWNGTTADALVIAPAEVDLNA